jgi:hypothetical protein
VIDSRISTRSALARLSPSCEPLTGIPDLTEAQRALNHSVECERVIVEDYLGRLKGVWKVLRETYRDLQRLAEEASSCYRRLPNVPGPDESAAIRCSPTALRPYRPTALRPYRPTALPGAGSARSAG